MSMKTENEYKVEEQRIKIQSQEKKQSKETRDSNSRLNFYHLA